MRCHDDNVFTLLLVRFHIHSVKREDRGTYFCVADNGVGKAKKRHVALEVRIVPELTDVNSIYI